MKKNILLRFLVFLYVGILSLSSYGQCLTPAVNVPAGAVEMTMSDVVVASGEVLVVSSDLDLGINNLKISAGGSVYVKPNVKLTAKDLTLNGKMFVADAGGYHSTGAITVGQNAAFGSATSELYLGSGAYFTGEGSLVVTQGGSFGPNLSTVDIFMGDASVFEVCGTTSIGEQEAFHKTGTGVNGNAYFINRAPIASAYTLGIVTLSSTPGGGINWIVMNSSSNVLKGTATKCGDNATAGNCTEWPTNLSIGNCNEAEPIRNGLVTLCTGGGSTGGSPTGATLNKGFSSSDIEGELEFRNCVDVTGVTLSCGAGGTQVGTFSNGISGAALEVDRGIFLTTGDVEEAFTDNSNRRVSDGGGNAGSCGDADLNSLDDNSLGTYDEAVLEFDFVMPLGTDGIRIPFQFASDEYPTYVCSRFNDVFGFWISGGTIGTPQNIALIPATTNPTAVNYVNGGQCGQNQDGATADLTQTALFIDNNDGQPGAIYTEYNGVTKTLYASISGLTAGMSYHFKMAIGDIGDAAYDSGVWVGAIESLEAGGDLVECNLDTDGDGVADFIETATGTNPNDKCDFTLANQNMTPSQEWKDADCDGDGVRNAKEVLDATNLLDDCDYTIASVTLAITSTGDCDGDGVANNVDTDPNNPNICRDADNDGCDDCAITGADGSGGSATNDGLDTDGDGVCNAGDLDDDNDGIPDAIEGTVDTDGDGIPNSLDLDSDNDGVPDIVEAGGTDTNGDGLIDTFTDTDGDGQDDNVTLTAIDTDNDGVPNYLDLDSDNDGTPDVVENGGADTDGNGVLDAFVDTDNDGLSDVVDGNNGGTALVVANSDSDTVPNYLDLDSDNDGIADVVENGGADVNGDGLLDAFVDADGDGFSDVVDTDNNLTPAVNDGIGTTLPNGDTDKDGVPNALDLDSDNDGIVDAIEAGGTDSDGNGELDAFADADGNGFSNVVDEANGGTALVNPNTDGDAVPNYLDIDSDGDGIVDNIEAQTTAGYVAPSGTDTDNDGIDDNYDVDCTPCGSITGVAIVPNNHDGTDEPDYLDLDSDNDGETDLLEGHDTNGNGIIDGGETAPAGTDADGDGLDDNFDTKTLDATNGADGTNASNGTFAGNNLADADNLGVGDLDYREQDSDGDGIDDNIDLDDDNDGIPDLVEGTGDKDGDGIPDYLDLDSDNDGIPDVVEAGGIDADGDGLLDGFVDANNDGQADGTPLTALDADNDGIPNYLDLDSDNDGTPDVVENGGTDTNGDGVLDAFVDTDNDGLSDVVDTNNGGTALIIANSDTDTIPNYLDLDSDNDGIADVVENGGTDANGDGILDGFVDADGDGFNDLIDTDNNLTPTANDGQGTTLPTEDADKDGVPNYLDLDSDNDGIVDAIEAGGTDTDGNGELDAFADADGNGFSNVVDVANGGTALTNPNTDGDAVPNYLDIDSDGDGIVDNIEAQTTAGYIAPTADNNGNGLADNYEGATALVPNNHDGTDEPDYLDLDSDNDGESDVLEGHDTNGNGIIDGGETAPAGTDADGDGLDDNFDTKTLDATNGADGTNASNGTFAGNNLADADVPAQGDLDYREQDSDGDGIDDAIDLDDDNDGIPDLVEGTGDADGDGIPNHLDLDSDNDGIVDLLEAGGTDADGNGIVDVFVDADNDGLADAVDNVGGAVTNGTPLANPNTDGDAVADALDIDSDNDGILDNTEAQTTAGYLAPSGTDTDKDGIDDVYDVDCTPCGSITGVAVVPVNKDSDAIANYLDIDSDNDGIVDNVEFQTTAGYVAPSADTDGNGYADNYETAPGSGLAVNAPFNTDGDAEPDYLDLNSDNDITSDNGEVHTVPPTGLDADNDGLDNAYDVDGTSTTNNGGASNNEDVLAYFNNQNPSTLEVDFRDPSVISNLDDFDGDGITDENDVDDDNDGILDVHEALGFTPTGTVGDDCGFPATNFDAHSYISGSGAGEGLLGAKYRFTDVMTVDGNNLDGIVEITAITGNAVLLDIDKGSSAEWQPEYSVPTPTNNVAQMAFKVTIVTSGTTTAYPLSRFGGVVYDIDGANAVESVILDRPGLFAVDANSLLQQQTVNGVTTFLGPDDTYSGVDLAPKLAMYFNYYNVPQFDIRFSAELLSATANTNLGSVSFDVCKINGLFDPSNTASSSPSQTNGTSEPSGPATGYVYTVNDGPDTDGDGLSDDKDLDADNDGIPDVIEAGGTDANGDGHPGGAYVKTDVDGNGLPNAQAGTPITMADKDQDGKPNHIDLDSDNDGIFDVIEAGGVDGDNDGLVGTDPFVDSDGDGFADIADNLNEITGAPSGNTALPVNDADNDGIDDFLDLDSDNDGIPDAVEGGKDSDGDGNIDAVDLDSDNDGLADIVEAGGTDTDGNGVVDGTFTDTDNDGLADAFDTINSGSGAGEVTTGTALANPDTDNDGIANTQDLDSDNDGTADVVENGGADTNGDGVLDAFVDADNDGFSDVVDTDNGGTAGTPLVIATTDTDTQPDYLDLDSDNDGIADVIENGGTDANGDGVLDTFVDADNDGFSDVVDTNKGGTALANGDADKDGIPNAQDLDSDNDGIVDAIEAGGTDANGDGLLDAFVDADNDGLSDVVDTDNGGTAGVALTNPNTDGDDFPNYLDIDSDGDGIVDNIEAQTTAGYIAPTADNNGNGLADNYEGATALVPNNHDGADEPDYLDLDSDNDGEADVLEGHDLDGNGTIDGGEKAPAGTDTDGDGLDDNFDVNVLDATNGADGTNASNGTTTPLTQGVLSDSDNLGVGDLNFREQDSDGDGIDDLVDLDDDNDGIPDLVEGTGDKDGDGIPDYLDLDSDNDGIPDVVEAGGIDNDGDGLLDGFVDTDNDGKDDNVTLTALDFDDDGIPNYLDLDSDNDGTADVVENGGTDTDGDGVLDAFVDTDNDGFSDVVDTNNGGTSLVIAKTDTDGQPDYLDLDSDNDGIADVIENGGTDANGDGILDDFVDADNDGFSDVVDTNKGGTSLPNGDADKDGIPNAQDLDSDNDGIVDAIEAGGTDANGDGELDAFVDADNDGLSDVVDTDNGGTAGVALTNPNTDGDAVPNYLDIDSDGDGIVDNIEAQTTAGYVAPTADNNGNGLADNYEGATALAPNNHDGTDEPDYLDLDSDNDGEADLLEGHDLNGNAVIDGTENKPSGLDADKDGLDDNFDTQILDATNGADGTNASNGTFAGNNLADADNLGVGDLDYREQDSDGDGIDDNIDLDDDNDGIPDLVEGTGDKDGDGIPNYLDLDSDNDGIPDVVEAGGTDADGDGLLDGFVDTDNDGKDDNVTLTALDSDDDGIPNYLDLDSDNDGTPDVVENGGTDADGDGVLDDYIDTDNDGFSDVVDTNNGGTSLVIAKTDTDGQPDYLDLDSDNDGIPDVVENGGTDADGDGVLDAFVDADGDGFSDVVDANNGGTSLPNGDADKDGVPNYLDLDSDNDGIVDAIEAGGADANGDGELDAFVDADNDGLSDVVDTNNGGTVLANPNTDGDAYPNYLDIDSDGDGIVDNIEAQTTAGYVAPTADNNGNGLADNYEGATALVPNNYDGTDEPDYLDLDTDNDGELDVLEAYDTNGNGTIDGAEKAPAGADADGDGLDDNFDVNVLDATNGADGTNASNGTTTPLTQGVLSDSDNLNVGDLNYREDDTDGDGIDDAIDLDDDNDGIPDLVEGTNDTDGDGIPDDKDLDADNDGVPDIVEAGGIDTDGNGKVDGVFVDTDNDGLADVVDNVGGAVTTGTPLTNPDTDNDGIPNYKDLDSDNDGTTDVTENGGADVDGQLDNFVDADGDGLSDVVDTENGGTAGTPLVIPNTDGDTQPDYLDLDSDNDGLADVIENGGTDANGDGVLDDFVDTDTDGLNDLADGNNGGTTLPNGDADSDGIPNAQDLDSDNDGIADVIEAGGDDADKDGKLDNFVDADNDGLSDVVDTDNGGTAGVALTNPNTDGDAYPNYLDIDSDDDGIIDNIEAQTTAGYVAPSGTDTDGDGLDDNYDGVNAIVPNNHDGDTEPDYLDLDSDNDGQPDALEGHDLDGDGVADVTPTGTDTDLDGLDDAFDTVVARGTTGANGENASNGTINPLTDGIIADFDNTGSGDLDYREDDTDGDGIGNTVDLDDDNDGILDTDEDLNTDGDNDPLTNPTDTDGDGIPNHLDLDSDNDGVLDIVEAGGTDTDGNGTIDGVFVDADNDGLADVVDNVGGSVTNGIPLPVPNTDGDAVPNYLDIDADNDGIVDNVEAQTPAGYVAPSGTDTDKDGIDDAYDVDCTPCGAITGVAVVPENNDTDALPNYLDIDSDNDGIVDNVEFQTTAGYVAPSADTDGNGLADNYETSPGSGVPTSSPVNTDGVDMPDYLDLNSDNDATTDIVEVYSAVTPSGNDADNDGLDDNYDEDGTGTVNNGGASNNENVLTYPNVQNPNTLQVDFRDATDYGTPIDSDGDGLFDNVDVDDDNDGILDVDEALGFTPTPNLGDDCGFPATNFDAHTYIGGTGTGVGTVGAQYRFTDVMTFEGNTLDGIVEITDITGGAVLLDIDKGTSTEWQPEYQVPFPKTGTADMAFKVTIVSSGTTTPYDLPRFGGVIYDIDGANAVESVELKRPGMYAVASNTLLSVTPIPAQGKTIFNGPDDTYSGVDLAPRLAVYFNYFNVPQFDIRFSANLLASAENTNLGSVSFDVCAINGLFDPSNPATSSPTQTNGTSEDSGPSTGYNYVVNDGPDTDGDGISDDKDLDSDNDGIPDVIEAGGDDADKDGHPGATYTATDVDANGLPNAQAGTPIAIEDKDNDGIPNHIDLDSDNDGIFDVVEAGGVDDNNDGIIGGNSIVDANQDGLADNVSPTTGTALPVNDADNDGLEDYLDLDSDNDGIPDTEEGAGDADGDGLSNATDLDSDNDGITDIVEANNGDNSIDPDNDGRIGTGIATDTDNDGLADVVDTDDNTTPVANDGTGTDLANLDSDNDGVKDVVDIDSDNDGIVDIIEAGGIDDNNDGRVDYPTAGDVTSMTDADNDGITDDAVVDTDDDNIADQKIDVDAGGTPLTVPNSDTDTKPDYIDIDTDGDGIVDNVEGPATVEYVAPSGTDTDNDGLDDAYDTDNGGTPVVITDTDNDGTPDYLDLDSDNDLDTDTEEGFDLDNNGTADKVATGNDSDNDGLDDGFDTDGTSTTDAGGATNNGTKPTDFPENDKGVFNTPDWRDPIDTDGDGILDVDDLDDDNDGIPDTVEGTADTDGDGIPDSLDLDADNDGIPDAVEAGGADVNGDGILDGFVDVDNDGLADSVDDTDNGSGAGEVTGGTPLPIPNTDGDGVPDYKDVDADNDGITDIVENGGTDTNGDGMIDVLVDANNDGLTDDQATSNLVDTDNDNIPDYLDLDSDNDGITDLAESGGEDTDNDGVIDAFNDANGDGLDDEAPTNATPLDTDEDGIPDSKDLDADGDGINDIIEDGGTDIDNDGMIDNLNDADSNGLDDDDINGNGSVDTDGDGIPNFQDTDSDGDSVPDAEEVDPEGKGLGLADTDGDGILNYLDTDDDNDGLPTIEEVGTNGGDCDDDGGPNYLDTDPCDFIVPAGFSPDGDGVNDYFVIDGIDRYEESTIVIFNRWGNKVFEAEDGYKNDWDGTSNSGITIGGNVLPVGTYFYVLDLGDGSKLIKGYIYLNK